MWRGRMARVAELADAHVADDWLSATFHDIMAEWQAQLKPPTATTQKATGCLPGCCGAKSRRQRCLLEPVQIYRIIQICIYINVI